MRASSLARNRISILQDSSEEGDEAPLFTGTALATDLPCDIDSVSGQESYRGRQLEAGVNYVIRLRYKSGITPKMRVTVTAGIFDGLAMDIRYVQHSSYERGKLPETWLMCGDVA